MRELLTVFLPVYFLLFFGFAFLWRTWRTYKATGVNPYRIHGNPGPEQVTSRYFRVLPLASLLVMVFYLLGENVYSYLARFEWLEHMLLQFLGLGLMSVALVLIVVAQAEMGKSWRIGVDYETPTEFVFSGTFGKSRNPIFLGIILSVIGYFLVLPNALTLLIVMLDVALIQVQIRVEEQFLERTHGEVYRKYCASVRRWF